MMDRAKKAFRRQSPPRQEPEYEPLTGSNEPSVLEGSTMLEEEEEVPFSWMEYAIFVLLGMAMLWAWYVDHHHHIPPPIPSPC